MIPKFRAWDKDSKVMREIQHLVWAEDNLIAHCPPRGHEFSEWFTVILNGWEYQLMQSTGLKDKNGVEIYEGDILKLNAIFLAPNDKIGYLEYSPKYGYSIIFEGNRLYRQEYWASTNKLNYEVIGNIYENPELLEGHEK
jgi:uncharacterized phage protein (TIGR01671 family)